MSITIYQRNPGELIATGKRNVQTFPSGLMRIDRQYIGAEIDSKQHRLLLQLYGDLPEDDGSPAIDGVNIFPEVQESRDGTGFVTYQVSAYGRANKTGRLTGYTQQNATLFLSGYGKISFSLRSVTGSIVIKTGDVITADDVSIPSETYDPSGFTIENRPDSVEAGISLYKLIVSGGKTIRQYQINFRNAVGNEGKFSIYIYLEDPKIRVTAQRDFGEWSEIDYVTLRNTNFTVTDIIT
jgi:hypothetical protein